MMRNPRARAFTGNSLLSVAPVPIGVSLVLIYQFRLKAEPDLSAFLEACRALAMSVGVERDGLEVCWLYGLDPTQPRTVRCIAAFWSLSAQVEFNKTKPWKQFLKATRQLPHETSVKLVEHLQGSVLPHRQLRRPDLAEASPARNR